MRFAFIRMAGSLLFCVLFIGITAAFRPAQTPPDPWTAGELLAPEMLATQLESGIGRQPLILNIGVMKNIKGATEIGAAGTPEGIRALADKSKGIPRDQPIIIYCGCCPLFKCPNVRPAFLLLKKEGFTHLQVLNLEHNLKTDWIARGYPMDEGKH